MEHLKNLKRWKGKYITEARYNLKTKQSEWGRKKKKIIEEVEEKEVVDHEGAPEKKCCVEGRSIVNIQVLAGNMYCSCCTTKLHFEDLEGEVRKGLASLFKIRCSHCLLVNDIPSDGTHKSSVTNRRVYDVNSKIASGAVNVGFGYAKMKKLFDMLDIPAPASNTFRKYEREAGKIVTEMAEGKPEEAPEIEEPPANEDTADVTGGDN